MKKKYLLPIILVITIVMVFNGCSRGSYSCKNSIEVNTHTKMSMSYEKFKGYKETEITVKEGESVVVSVEIVTESGSINAYIAKDNDKKNCSYEGNDIQTSSFDVTLSEAGKYTLRVDADNHKGSYSFSWK